MVQESRTTRPLTVQTCSSEPEQLADRYYHDDGSAERRGNDKRIDRVTFLGIIARLGFRRVPPDLVRVVRAEWEVSAYRAFAPGSRLRLALALFHYAPPFPVSTWSLVLWIQIPPDGLQVHLLG